MGKWIRGDLHVHSEHCRDGSVPILQIVAEAQQYCDFLAISGHVEKQPDWGEKQYQDILAARQAYPDMPIFHTAEQEFPIERHVMFVTTPDNREVELQTELLERYHRLSGVVGLEKAIEALRYVEEHWGNQAMMIFNHPNAPDVSSEHLLRLAESASVFKLIACVDRQERRAPQAWEIGNAWDQLLQNGHRIFARCGSDFHRHFSDGGHDYYPGEFVQDYLWVENNTYHDIFQAYRQGHFFCAVDHCLANPCFSLGPQSEPEKQRYHLRLAFTALRELTSVEIFSDAQVVRSFENISGDFEFEDFLPGKGYFRVRGLGKPIPRKYSSGDFEPLFLLNPLFII